MIMEFLINIVKNLVLVLLSGFEVITLPTQMISTLATITGYGAYVVGADLLLIIASVIMFWAGVKASMGIILFIWRLLPFT
jgi:hypothetical protein